MNFILDTDSYKFSHYLGYPSDTTHIYSYAESRGGKYPATVFLGLQKFIRELAAIRVTIEDLTEAAEFARDHGIPFNHESWMRIVTTYAGKIPVRIKAVAEGSLVPTSNVLVTVENTDPTMPWLTSYIETALLRAIWYPTTVATRIFEMKKRIKPYYDRTSISGDMAFGILDFSARGVSSLETASVGGLGHLINFMGSDNIPAILAVREFYDEPMAGYSVSATEHSVMTSYLDVTHELESFEYLIENMLPQNGILSVVCDTWNVFDAARKFVSLQERIRNKNGTLVIRPDSGEMAQVLPELYEIVRGFGVVENEKGYEVLQNVKVLQGDGISENTVTTPFLYAEMAGISADSIMTGSGGGLMQSNIDRDTLRFAFKASNVTRAGVDYPISKNPITDSGKRSKAGKLALVTPKYCSNFQTILEKNLDAGETNYLRTVYENGKTYNDESFTTIRNRLASNL